MEGKMEGEFYEALENIVFFVLKDPEGLLLRYESKESRSLVEHSFLIFPWEFWRIRVLSEKPDDIVIQKFEELIQRKKNKIQRKLNEIQQKLGDIKLKDIEKSLEWVKRELENIEKSLKRIRSRKRELKEKYERSKITFIIRWWSEYLAEEIRKLEVEEERLELSREELLGFLELEKIPKELDKIKKELEKIKFIEAQSDRNKREFIKDIIREMRREKVLSYKPKLQESPEYWNNL